MDGLSARGISKRFPGVVALSQVDLELAPGEVVGICGENGAGKSTLMRVLAGIERPDAGRVTVAGEELEPGSVAAAQRLGISLIQQELCLCEHLDAGANVMLGRERRRLGPLGWFSPGRERERARPALARVGLELDPATPVARLAIGQRQRVEIAKALAADARVLIMDEPTSSLTLDEAERLHAVVRELAAGGTAIAYVSHRLAEIEAVCDRVVVLRDGSVAARLGRESLSRPRLVRAMVGRDLPETLRAPLEPGPVVLELEGLRTEAFPGASVDLTLRSGEVVGLAGLLGAGRTELVETAYGLRRARGGRVRVAGRELDPWHPRAALEAGLALVPEDRKGAALLLEKSLAFNVSLATLASDARAGLVDVRRARERARQSVRELDVRTAGIEARVETLSGGNQQKVVLARALSTEPRALLLDEPTRGVDVGGKQEIWALIDRLARSGAAILFASSEMEEVLGLADRVAVLHEGRVAGWLERDELGEEAVMALATGGGERAA